MIKMAPSILEVVSIGLGATILFFDQHAYPCKGLFSLQSKELAAQLHQEVMWLWQIVEIKATSLPVAEDRQAVARFCQFEQSQ